jgi:hypothetical protein
MLSDTLIALINEGLQSPDSHEYYINSEGKFTGYSHEVTIYGNSYIVKGSDCSRCDGSHVDCHYVERVTTDPEEALENLQIIKSMEG